MECEVMSKTYEQMLVVPAAARVIGEMELYAKTHGFYISAFTAAMLALGDSATLITSAESVKVTKAAGSAWLVGDWIYWDEGNSNFTDIAASDRYCVGKAQKAASNGAVIGFVMFQDNFHPIQLGTTAVPILFTLAGEKVFDAHVTSSLVGSNVEPFTLETILTGIGAVGGRAKFTLSTEVALGDWANALKAEINFGVAGTVNGIGSAFCAELIMPETPPVPGHYAALEAEIVMPSGAGCGVKTAYVFCNVGGADKATFAADGYFAIIQNAGDSNVGLFYVNTDTMVDAYLRWQINGTDYFMLLAADVT